MVENLPGMYGDLRSTPSTARKSKKCEGPMLMHAVRQLSQKSIGIS